MSRPSTSAANAPHAKDRRAGGCEQAGKLTLTICYGGGGATTEAIDVVSTEAFDWAQRATMPPMTMPE